jgi:hypothetical protein
MCRNITARSTEDTGLMIDVGLVHSLFSAARTYSGDPEVVSAVLKCAATCLDCAEVLTLVESEGTYNQGELAGASQRTVALFGTMLLLLLLLLLLVLLVLLLLLSLLLLVLLYVGGVV